MRAIDVFFDDIHLIIIKHLEEAKLEIKIAVAWFTDIDIYKTLVKKAKNNVSISIIIANHEFNKRSKVDFRELLTLGAEVLYIGKDTNSRTERLMHNKFCIIDNSTVINGSFNYTYKARLNDENIVLIKDDAALTQKFKNKFEAIKPGFAFTLENNEVKIRSIEEIIKKWDKPVAPNKPADPNNISSILSKF
jgi:phosphatidylserine/phosphatidylglycerophosphate/cardiolipin synthase-like enzyme